MTPLLHTHAHARAPYFRTAGILSNGAGSYIKTVHWSYSYFCHIVLFWKRKLENNVVQHIKSYHNKNCEMYVTNVWCSPHITISFCFFCIVEKNQARRESLVRKSNSRFGMQTCHSSSQPLLLSHKAATDSVSENSTRLFLYLDETFLSLLASNRRRAFGVVKNHFSKYSHSNWCFCMLYAATTKNALRMQSVYVKIKKATQM